MTMRNIIQTYINQLVSKGYRLSTDVEGNITVSDDKHGVINLRMTTVGNDVRFDLSKNVNASDDFEQDVLDVFTDALNR